MSPLQVSRAPAAGRAFGHRAQLGISLIDTMVGSTILLLVILGHVASTMAQHGLAKKESSRSTVLRTAGRFMERLRGDEDWAGLYARLRLQQSLVSTLGRPDALLSDGRRTYAPSTYVPGFIAPEDFTVLVDVPFAPDAVTGQNVLREDDVDADLLLPSDLDGDGAIDALAHDANYAYLPVRATFRWTGPLQGGPEQFSVVTWIRGER